MDRIYQVLELDKIRDRLADLTTNPMSRALAESLSPAADLAETEDRQEVLSDALRLYVKNGMPRIGGLRDITPSLARLAIGGTLSCGELLGIGYALRIARLLISYHRESSEPMLIDRHFTVLAAEKGLEEEILSAILSEEEVADNASPALAQIRRQTASAHNQVREILNRIVSSTQYQKALQENIVTMRDGRYVVPVRSEYKSSVPGIVHDMSSTGATLFIEPSGVVDANNKIRELMVKEQQEIERILADLSAKAAAVSEILKSNQREITELDFLFAKAKLALAMDAVRPKMNDERRLLIKKGRHPLIDPKKVVPVTVPLGGGHQTLVITGPNTGGKTVTLKTVGLLSLMAQCGLQVPAAEGTELTVFDEIFADIGDEQSIEQSLSTFSGHMKTIVTILERVTDRSLVLFDELGAGTDPTEGAALAVAILKHVRAMGALTVATTHYSEIKLYALQTDGVENAGCEFNIDTLSPTYRLLIGVPGKSNAFAISERLGLPKHIIESAAGHLSEESIRFEDVIAGLEQDKQRAEEDRAAAESDKEQIRRLREELEKERQKLQRQREQIRESGRAESRKIWEKAREEADALMEELRSAQKAKDSRKAEQARQQLRHKLKESERMEVQKKEYHHKPPKTLNPGDTVEMVELGLDATVLSKPDGDGMVSLQAGIMKMTAHLSKLRLKKEKKVTEPTGGGKKASLRTEQVPSELDIRGQMAEDGVYMAEQFIDRAVMGHLEQISIIHGKGTGALRAAIHTMLKRNKSVKSFRMGTFGEGEMGVTIVELK